MKAFEVSSEKRNSARQDKIPLPATRLTERFDAKRMLIGTQLAPLARNRQSCNVHCHVCREYRYKDNVTMVENGTRVSAYNTKKFVFLREKSVGDPAVDLITTVNIPAWVSHELKVVDDVRKVGN